jgi:uncharacterized membrane protein
MGPFSGAFIVIGFALIAIGMIVRKFWPHRKGTIEFWILSFPTSEWLSLTTYGIFLIALGIFLGTLTPL